MMGRLDKQLRMVYIDMSSMVPDNHLLRIIKENVDFEFIYDRVSDYYSSIGRPSIDLVLLIKMLLIGYLYGIKSERRLEEEVNLNIAYRWFCDLDLDQRVPDHSTFSQNRRRRFQDGQVFEDLWKGIFQQILQLDLIKGDLIAYDGTFLPIKASSKSLEDQAILIRTGMQSYLDLLNQELSEQPGFQTHEAEVQTKTGKLSRTDPEARWRKHGGKTGLGYLMQTSTDCSSGMITGVDVYLANQKESTIVLRHLEKQIQSNVPINRVVMDKGYDAGLGKGVKRRRIIASGFYPAFYRGRMRVKDNPERARQYFKLRQIWIEGRFAVLKREHKLSPTTKKRSCESQRRMHSSLPSQ